MSGVAYSSTDRFQKWTGIGLLLPLLVYLTVFYLVPLGRMLVQSLFDPGFTLIHYQDLIKYPVYGKILLNTFKISGLVACACILMGLPMAWALVFARPVTKALLLTLVMIPFWISVLVRTYSWMIILGRYGIVNRILMWTGITNAPLELMYNRIGVLVGMIYVMLPYAVLPMVSVMSGIDRTLFRASTGLGATFGQTFRYVFLPLAAPGIGVAFMLVFILSAGIFITPTLMGGPSDTMIAMSINAQLEMVNNWGFASSLSIVLLVTVLFLLILSFRLFGRHLFSSGASPSFRKESQGLNFKFPVLTSLLTGFKRVGRWAGKALLHIPVSRKAFHTGHVISCTLIAFFLAFPVLIIMPIAFSNDFIVEFPPKTLGLNLFISAFTSSAWTNAAVNSLKVAAAVTVLSLLIGVPAGMHMSRKYLPGKEIFYAVFLSPIILPGIVSAVAMYFFIADLRLIGTLSGLIIAHTVLSLPYVLVVMRTSFNTLDPTLERASYSLGAGKFRTFFSITLPLIRPGLFTAAIFAFIASFDELITALFICGSRAVTLPKKMWDGIRDEMDPTIAAVSASLILLAIGFMALTALIEKKQNRLKL
ncbi:MAG TPA: hypothetical protein DHV36_07925 [Desulfobacteraceae bacterium]|nr:hypothetical protein [Desulfobacteraceae bacterium]